MSRIGTYTVYTSTPADTNYTEFVVADSNTDIHIDELFVVNQDGANAADGYVCLVPTGTTAAAGYNILKKDSVAAGVGEKWLTGCKLVVPAGYELHVKSSGASDLTFTAVGMKVSTGTVRA